MPFLRKQYTYTYIHALRHIQERNIECGDI